MSNFFEIPGTVARQAPLFMEFSRQADTGVGSHSLLQGIVPTEDLTGSPALQAGPLPSEPPGKLLVGTDPHTLTKSLHVATKIPQAAPKILQVAPKILQVTAKTQGRQSKKPF